MHELHMRGRGRSLHDPFYRRDSTNRKRKKQSRSVDTRFRALAESLPDMVVRFDRKMRCMFVNSVFEQITGVSRNQFYGKTSRETGIPEEVQTSWETAMTRAIETGRNTGIAFSFPQKSGTRNFRGDIVPVFDSTHQIETFLLIAWDITGHEKSQETSNRISFHDNVTGLYNRGYFEENMRRLDTGRSIPICFILGDINYLKLTNDAFGHGEGDRLLNKIAETLRRCCRDEDIIARWGGDEFAVILPKTDIDAAREVCRRIKNAIENIADLPIPPSMALGVAVKKDSNEDIQAVISAAEKRMYENKLALGRENRNMVISSLMGKINRINPEYNRHMERLRKISWSFVRTLNLGARELESLQIIIPLHEIGKVVVPEEYLRRPGPLSRYEWKALKRYPEAGFHIARAFADTARVSEEILSLRENWNGSGYPRGIKKNEIPLLSRFFAIVDSYDTMTRKRTYAPALTHEQAMDELSDEAEKQFDPEMVREFVRIFESEAPAPVPEPRRSPHFCL